MKIEMDIWSAGEMAAFGKFMSDMALVRASQEVTVKQYADVVNARGYGTSPEAGQGGEAGGPVAEPGTHAIPASSVPEKKPRSATKKELAEQAASVEASAKAEAEARMASEAKPEAKVVDPVDPPAITAEEVKNSIIDLLNDWSEAAPSDPEIRTSVLGPMLRTLDADKIRNIDAAKYAMVPSLIDESRAKLAEFKAAAAYVVEE